MLGFNSYFVEDVKKKEIKSLFSNEDFKVGLEFEFYNEKFLEANNRPSATDVLILGRYVDIINETKEQNKKIVKENKSKRLNAGNNVSKASQKKKIISVDQILGDFEGQDSKDLYSFFSRNGINKRELADLTYRYVNSALEKSAKDMAEGDYQKEIFKTYNNDSKKLLQFMMLVLQTANTETPNAEIKKYYSQESNRPSFVKSPKITTGDTSDPSRWTIGTDLSVLATLGGIEFISPVMNASQAIDVTRGMFDYIKKNGNTKSHHSETAGRKDKNKRDAQCGLHINISFTPERMKNFDALKFILFSNESQSQSDKLFSDRKHAEYVQSSLKKIRGYLKDKQETADKDLLGQMVEKNIKFGKNDLLFALRSSIGGKFQTVNLSHYSFSNQSKKRGKAERIEIRYFGGEDYEKKFDLFKRIFGELLHALDVATDPEKEKNKYHTKLYRLFNQMSEKKENENGSNRK